jgi:hypothetical protein
VLTVTGQVLHRDTDWAEFAPDGRLQYLDLAAHQLVLEDLTTQEITTFDLPPGEFYAIQWNPLGEQALVTMATNIGNGSNRCRCEFWVFDPQLSEFSLIVDDAQSFPQSPPAYRPVISELSPNWERLLYYRGETQGYHYLELTTMQSIPLNLPDAPDSSVWRWHNNDLLIPWPLQVGREFFTYNIPTRDVQEFVDLNHETLSPDGQYILNYFSPPIIYDLTNNSSTPLPPHSALHPSALKHITTQWHPEAPWVRITENTAVSGGGGGPLLSSLVRADGAYRRENNPARWLPVEINPDTVTTIPYEPEPPILQPVEVLKTDHQSRALYWRPDGTQIAMDLDMTAQVGNQSQGPYNIWNIQTGTESVAFEVQAENVVFSWTVLDDGTFTPGIQHVPQDYLPLQSPDGRQYLAEGSDGYWLNLFDSDTEEAIAEINEIESWTSFSYQSVVPPSFWTVEIRSRTTGKNWEIIEKWQSENDATSARSSNLKRCWKP